MNGLCECGCGVKTKVMLRTSTKEGYKKGDFRRFLPGHNLTHHFGSGSPRWKGGKYKSRGYVYILFPEHPKANSEGYVQESVLVAENILGKPLPLGAVIHHVDGNKSNNIPSNLVICENDSYHQTLHRRSRTLKESGFAHYRKCPACKKYDDPKNMKHYGRIFIHISCARPRARAYYHDTIRVKRMENQARIRSASIPQFDNLEQF